MITFYIWFNIKQFVNYLIYGVFLKNKINVNDMKFRQKTFEGALGCKVWKNLY